MYEVVHDDETGMLAGVRIPSENKFVCPSNENPDWLAFLRWNANQVPPLDISNWPAKTPLERERFEALVIDLVEGGFGVERAEYKHLRSAILFFVAAATPTQKADAAAYVAAWVWTRQAQDDWVANRNPDRKDLRNQAAQLITDIDTFLALGSPNQAQTLAIVRRLCQGMKAVVKRLIQID